MDIIDFVRNYDGTFDFLRAMRQRVEQGGQLTPGMVAAIERCAEREPVKVFGPPKPIDPADGLDLSVLPEGTTRYAVRNSEGTLSFLRIDRPYKRGSGWIGWVFVKLVSGPAEDRIGKQKPGEPYVGKYVGLLGKVLHDPYGAMARYGQEIGQCGKCGKRLTDDTSRSLGIGPECRKRFA